MPLHYRLEFNGRTNLHPSIDLHLLLVQNFYNACVAVHTNSVAGFNDLRRSGRTHDTRDAKLAGYNRRVGQRTAGIRNQTGDLRERDDPAGVRHTANHDVALLELVKFLRAGHNTRGAFNDARGTRNRLENLDLVLSDLFLFNLKGLEEDVRIAPKNLL